MLVWCAVLFLLGVMAFLDSIYNMGEIFRRINSILFLLISLALLVRTTTKKKTQKIENLKNKIFSLETQIKTMEQSKEKLGQY